MDFLLDIIDILMLLVNLWILFSATYYFIVSLWGYGAPKKYAQHEPASRFLVFIPACNEEKVIADAIHSLRATDYPRELVDICVIADNCKDHTRELVESCGECVYETCSQPGEPVGKPHAIKKVLDQHPEYYTDYDMLVIVDADNVVTGNFFREINSQYLSEGKPAAIQSYLGCKNKRGLVAFFYYHSYTISNRFYQLAKDRLGVNCSIGGTGLAFSMQALRDIGGWQANSLTEDMEMQVLFTERGQRILWNHFARTYDEKPTHIRTVFRQRIRWSQGHWYVSLRGTLPLIKAFMRRRIKLKELVSSFGYMFSMPMSIQIPLSALSLIISMLMEQFHLLRFLGSLQINALKTLVALIPFVYMLFVLFFVADARDNHVKPSLVSFGRILVSYLTIYPICLVSQVLGFFKHRNQQIWVKTAHDITAAAAAEENDQKLDG